MIVIVRAPEDQDAWANWQLLEYAQKTLLADADKQILTGNFDSAVVTVWNKSSDDEKLKLLAGATVPWSRMEGNENAKLVQSRKLKAKEKFTTTLVARDLEKPRKTHVLRRGEYDLPVGEPVSPGVIEVMGGLPEAAPGNRLGLAQWLTSRSIIRKENNHIGSILKIHL